MTGGSPLLRFVSANEKHNGKSTVLKASHLGRGGTACRDGEGFCGRRTLFIPTIHPFPRSTRKESLGSPANFLCLTKIRGEYIIKATVYCDTKYKN